MRDLLLFATLVSIAPLILRAPIIGLLAWIWITLMNPQREVYGFLRGFELNFYIAALTVFSWVISRERKTIPLNPMILALITFGLWTCVTTQTALDPAYASIIWDRTVKTIVLAVAVAALVVSKTRLQAVIWTMIVSFGYYAVKGGGFVLLTGGHQHVYGPENTMIADNNSLGLALTVMLPLMNYLRLTSRTSATRFICLGAMGFTFLAILGTYSRGALLALVAAAAAYALKSRSGAILLLIGGIVAVSSPSILPPSWFQRMATIQSYNHDASFEGRVAAWKTSLNIAEARPLVGGGFSAVERTWVVQTFHSPDSLDIGKAAHSIYFEVLGDHGFVGLALYLLIFVFAWINTFRIRAITREREDLRWADELVRMLQVSMVALLIGGAALSMAYYDGFLILLAMTVALLQIVRRPAESQADATQPRWRQIALRPPALLGPAAAADGE